MEMRGFKHNKLKCMVWIFVVDLFLFGNLRIFSGYGPDVQHELLEYICVKNVFQTLPLRKILFMIALYPADNNEITLIKYTFSLKKTGCVSNNLMHSVFYPLTLRHGSNGVLSPAGIEVLCCLHGSSFISPVKGSFSSVKNRSPGWIFTNAWV